MANEKNIPGHEGTLAYWDTTASAYKPVVCLTSSSVQKTMNMLEKVNMCTQGQTVRKPQSLDRTVSIEGEFIDTTEVGGVSAQASYDELDALQEAHLETGIPTDWRLSRGPMGYRYFSGFISDLSDSFQAGEDATFTASLTSQGKFSETDPHAAP
ncbi:hypothetical protein [Sphingobacterium sp.]|uniref:hypothetical protein n=1 Tax=Sphingobacterium sp. TaxID=341027 RepID=UPI002899FFFB|nr:hypothetical protein [Sphingobacterium sp.]